MNKRHRRALMWTGGVLLFLAGPFLYRIHLESKSTELTSAPLGQVNPFIYHDTKDVAVTRETLMRSVTIVLNIPTSCGENCAAIKTRADEIAQWVADQLSPGYTEEKNPLRLLVTGNGFVPTQSGWQIIAEAPVEGEILPVGFSAEKPWLVIIDPNLAFAGIWDLNSPVDHENIGRVLSRTAFDQYLGNYLARRTFMGPRRDQR